MMRPDIYISQSVMSVTDKLRGGRSHNTVTTQSHGGIPGRGGGSTSGLLGLVGLCLDNVARKNKCRPKCAEFDQLNNETLIGGVSMYQNFPLKQ